MTAAFRSSYFTVLILFIWVIVARGEVVIGRYANEFLSHGAGARSLAMGSASVAAPSAGTAAYHNPAALLGVSRRHLEFMHASEFENAYTYDFLSFVQPTKRQAAIGVSVLYQRVNDISLTRLSDPSRPIGDNNRVVVDKETGDHEFALLIGTAKGWSKGWQVGATGKLLTKSLAGESAYGLGFDLGLQRAVRPHAQVGLTAHDITTSVLAWSTGRTESILPSMVVGGEYQFDFHAANAQISLAADLENRFESRGDAAVLAAGPWSLDPHAGIEYLISKTVALRGGMNADNFTYGAGLEFSSLNINAAFQNHDELGLTHRISAAVSW